MLKHQVLAICPEDASHRALRHVHIHGQLNTPSLHLLCQSHLTDDRPGPQLPSNALRHMWCREGRELPYACLDALRGEFQAVYGPQAQTAKSMQMQKSLG